MKPTLRMTGMPEFDRKLSAMGDVKSANRIAKSVLGAQATVAKKAIRSLAPPSIKDTVGVRNGKNRGGIQETKVGINVGKRSKKSRAKITGWAVAIVLGTKQRFRKKLGGQFAGAKNVSQSQLSTGAIPAHPIVKQGFAMAQSGMLTKGEEAFKRAVERERKKAQLNK